MRIVAKKTLVAFYEKHADAKTAIEDWHEKVSRAEWEHFPDLRNAFNSVDGVGNKRFVFNIKGNACRLVALILFRLKTVYIRFIGTHDEYDDLENIQNI